VGAWSGIREVSGAGGGFPGAGSLAVSSEACWDDFEGGGFFNSVALCRPLAVASEAVVFFWPFSTGSSSSSLSSFMTLRFVPAVTGFTAGASAGESTAEALSAVKLSSVSVPCTPFVCRWSPFTWRVFVALVFRPLEGAAGFGVGGGVSIDFVASVLVFWRFARGFAAGTVG
jgi:hypothetical protein